jgi:GNAT superfamily N-acetyltransferase
VTIRRAAPSDVAAMREVEVDAGARFRDVGLARIADDPPPEAAVLLAHVVEGTAWVALDADGGVVGYAVASELDGEGHLDQVSVRERAMGRGVGSALVAGVCDWSAAEGHPAVTLTTYRDVPWNAPWYARRGFAELAETKLTTGLRAILERERAAGLEPPPRVAMRRPASR